MMGSLSLGAVAGGISRQGRTLTTRTALSELDLTVQMARIPSAVTDDLQLDVLNIDGESMLDYVADAKSPQLAMTPTPGRVSGKGKPVSALTEPLEVGALYVVSYDILVDHGTERLFFAAGAGSPFRNSAVAEFTPGRHKILVEAEDTDTDAILRVNGDLTFGFISCRKAQWQMTLPPGVAHPELAKLREPGRLSGTGTIVSALVSPLEVGASYTLRYEIKATAGPAALFTAAGAGSPFPFRSLPTTIGHHAITLIAQDTDTDAIARLTGDVTFGSFSCRKAGGIAGRQIQLDVASGSARSRSTIYTPEPGVLYAASWGDDTRGTGAFETPFATPAAACAQARPGDTVYLRPGTYAPFDVTVSGTAGLPITVTTLPDEAHQAIIEGDLSQHVVFGGTGVPENIATRDGVYIKARDHIHIRNLTIRNVWRSGIFVTGEAGEQHGHHIFSGNRVSYTGSSAILICGENPGTIIPVDETSNLRTTDVIIEYNDVSYTNVETDFNGGVTNSKGEPGGVTEAISVASSCSNIITRYNDVHDTRQYGIDYKAGVKGGAIHDNRVWNVQRYGIYLDAGRRFVEDVAIYNNQVWACRLGIVLSREAGSNTVDYDVFTADTGVGDFNQSLANIDIYNNLVWDIETAGIFCQRHPQKDGPDGQIANIRIRHNTVYNANRGGAGRDINLSGWSDPDFITAGIVRDIDFVGNIVWNDTAEVRVLDTFTGQPGFDVQANLIGVDPLFAAPTATPPDLSLAVGSPAGSFVSTSVAGADFAADIGGKPRSALRAAGAHEVV